MGEVETLLATNFQDDIVRPSSPREARGLNQGLHEDPQVPDRKDDGQRRELNQAGAASNQKAHWVAESHRLKAGLRAADRDVDIVLSPGGILDATGALVELSETARVDAIGRQKLEKGLGDRLGRTRNAVMRVKSLVASIEEGQAQDVRSLAELMDQAETEITRIKEDQHQEFDKLCRAERAFSKELDLFIQRIKTWDTDEEAGNSNKPTSLPKAAWHTRLTQQRKGLLPEVQEFDEFLERTGETGGWEPGDHKKFLRILAEHQGDYSLIVQPALSELLMFDRGGIIAHCRWHAEYEDLLRRKRAAIMRWRAQKEGEREDARQAQLVEAESVKGARLERQEQLVAEGRERQEQQQKLRAWKEAKEQEEALRRAEEAAVAERREHERLLLKQKQAQAKQTVQAFREAQQAEAERRKRREKEEEERRRQLRTPSAKDLERRRERDRQLLETRKAADAAKEAERQEKEARLERLRKQVEVHVDRDPHRLLKPTKVVEGRRHADENDASAVGGLFDQKLVNPRMHQTRAMPGWRQPLRS